MNRSTVALLLILTGAVGCGSSARPATRDAGSDEPPPGAGSDGSSPDTGQPDGRMPGPMIAADQFLEAYRTARCSYLARCGLARSLDACLASTFSSQGPFRYQLAAVGRGVSIYDAEAAAACVASIAAQACTFTTPTGDGSCARIFSGTIPTGGACYVSSECAPVATGTALCLLPTTGCGACCYGTCVVAPIAAAGGSCVTSADGIPVRCPEGQYCHLRTGTCMPVAALGEACERPSPQGGCQAGLFCASAAFDEVPSQGYRCNEPAPTGAWCNRTNVPTSGVLSCANLSDVCFIRSGINTSICTPRVPIGGSCAGAPPQTCELTAYCDGSVCRALGAPGEACMVQGTCEGELVCLSGSDGGTATCGPPTDQGICPPPPA
jgi:hypothetical protein